MYITNKYKNRIVIGSAQFGFKYGITNDNKEISKNKVRDILNLCNKYNIKDIDTAFTYGASHEKIIDFLKNEKKKKFIITTKINLKELKKDKKNQIKKKLFDFKRKIPKSHKVNLLCHDQKILDKKNIRYINILNKLKKKKVIFKIGVSVYDQKYIIAGLKNKKIDIVEAPGSILDQRINNLKEYRKEIKKKLFLRSIFLQGILLTKPNKIKSKVLKKKVLAISQLSKKIKMSKLSLCVNFALQILNPNKIIFGIANKKQLKQFLKIKYNFLNKNIDFKKFEILNYNLVDPRKW